MSALSLPRASLAAFLVCSLVLGAVVVTGHPAGKGDRQESASLGHTFTDPPYTLKQPCYHPEGVDAAGNPSPYYGDTVDSTSGATSFTPGIPPPPFGVYDDCPPLDSLDNALSAAQIEHRYPSYFTIDGWPGAPYIIDDGISCQPGFYQVGWGVKDVGPPACFGPSSPGQPKDPGFFPPPYAGPSPTGGNGNGGTDYCQPQTVEPWPDPPLPSVPVPEVRWTDESPFYTGNQNFVDAGESLWQLQEPDRWFGPTPNGEQRFHMEWSELGDDTLGTPLPVTLATSDDPHTIEGPPDLDAIKLAWDGYIMARFNQTVVDLPVYDAPFWEDDRGADIRLFLNADATGTQASELGGPRNPANFCVYGSGPEDSLTGDGRNGPFYFIGTAMVGKKYNTVPATYDSPRVNGAPYPTADGKEEFTFDLSYYYTPSRMERGISADKAGLLKYILIEASAQDVAYVKADFEWTPNGDESAGADIAPTRLDKVKFIPHVDRFGHPDWVYTSDGILHKEDNTEDKISMIFWCFGLQGDDPKTPTFYVEPDAGCDTASTQLFYPNGAPFGYAGPMAPTAVGVDHGWYDEDNLANMDNYANGTQPWLNRTYRQGPGDPPIQHQFVVPGDYTVCMRVATQGYQDYFATTPIAKIATFDAPQIHVACKRVHIANIPPVTEFKVEEVLGSNQPRAYQFRDLSEDPDWLQAFYHPDSGNCPPPKGNWKNMLTKSPLCGTFPTYPPGSPLPVHDTEPGAENHVSVLPDLVLPDHSGINNASWNADGYQLTNPPAGSERYDEDGLVKWTWDFGDGTGFTKHCITDSEDGDLNLDLLEDGCPFIDAIDTSHIVVRDGGTWKCEPPRPPTIQYRSNGPPDCNGGTAENLLPDDEYDVRNPLHVYKEDGFYLVTLTVEDADGGKATMTQGVLVRGAPNHPPVLKDENDLFIPVGTPVTFQMLGNDPDGDKLLYQWAGLPSWAVVDPKTRTFSGTPAVSGLYKGFTWSVTDGEFTVTQEFTITVYDRAIDSDGDGKTDVRDNCPNSPDIQAGSTALGQGNGCPVIVGSGSGSSGGTPPTPDEPTAPIIDTDSDGVADLLDVCPSVPDDQADADGDTLGDACDLDIDGDDVPQSAAFQGAATDNCPQATNAGQADKDGDGIGDACDELQVTVTKDPFQGQSNPALEPEHTTPTKASRKDEVLSGQGLQVLAGIVALVVISAALTMFAVRRWRS